MYHNDIMRDGVQAREALRLMQYKQGAERKAMRSSLLGAALLSLLANLLVIRHAVVPAVSYRSLSTSLLKHGVRVNLRRVADVGVLQ